MKTNTNNGGKGRLLYRRYFSFIPSPIVKMLLALLLVASAAELQAQTFVKEIFGSGDIEPRVAKDPNAQRYYITARTGGRTYITGLDNAGTILWTHELVIPNDVFTVTDMIVDNLDGTLACVARGNNRNYVFKYNQGAMAYDWIKSFPNTYIFQNIHFVSAANYIVTGEILVSQTTIFEISRAAGVVGYQEAGFVGEFFSTFDGTDIYGACRYYSSGSLFNPSLYRYDATTGANLWTNTYITNPPTVTARIYPVAPIVDNGNLVQLSSGDDAGFNTYQTGNTDAWLLQTDLAGNLAWTNHITIPGYTRLNAKKILNTATGYYLLIDAYNGSITDYFFVVKTDKNGNLQWINRYGISGINSVITGVEDNGFLYLTALSGSYTPGSNLLYLKLDQFGMSDPQCPYIRKWNATIVPYTNTQLAQGTATNSTSYTDGIPATVINPVAAQERLYCSTSSILPCNTLTGSLASGVLAFYPFGNGSLLDLSGNGNNLLNPTLATPSVDRDGNPNCAYNFNSGNPDFLHTPFASFLDNITSGSFSISVWYQPIGPRPVGAYELLVGRGNVGLHCPDTWGEWSLGIYDCRKAVMGFDMYSHWQGPLAGFTCQQHQAAITGNWHHACFVYNGSSYDLYVDNVLYSNSSGPCGWMSGNIGDLMLGVDYTGDLDDIIIYNRALSAAEVNVLYNLNGSCCDGVNSSNKQSGTGIKPDTRLADKGDGLSIYPNPANDKVSISAGKDVVRNVTIVTNTGAVAGSYDFSKTDVSIDIEHLSPGVYFMKVTTDAGATTKKLIKE